MQTPKNRVEIVIPVHNRRETTLQALRSLARIDTTGLDVHITIVDDGSTDGTGEAIRSQFPNVDIIAGDGTLHYAAGTNRGIAAALDRGADYILTANDDTIFHEQFLQRMLRTSRADRRAVVAALLLLWDQPHRVFQVDFKWNTWRGGWQQSDELTVFDFSKQPIEVEGLAGNCVLIPADAVRECGMMDERKFPYGWGDIQYFVRMRKTGWRLMVEPTAYVWCEPNTYPPPLRTESIGRVLNILFRDQRHPLNLHRQFTACWESAPNKLAATAAFGIYLLKLPTKAAGKLLRR
jgi:GT2 family glycosyltransferase